MLPLKDTIPSHSFPLITWILIVINALVFMLELSLSREEAEALFYLLGLVPARYSHPAWAEIAGLRTDTLWPFVTNMFLHGGWGHFLGNMWTLYIFGDNVEDNMGRRNFLLFYLLCGILASVTHYYTNIHSTLPAIGASGAISGVMGAYMLLFPSSKIIFWVPIFFFPYFVELSAFIYLLFWFVGQLISGTFSFLLFQGQVGGIAFWAHIGGFVAGMVLYKFFVRKGKYRFYEDEYFKKYLN
ncbi:MAG: rhomboid family intramembrane serine protease [Chitinophagales bacterium]|nr:MAG: rhomboid family intramembrane serine protease [Chitinophagales bacterium]